MNMSLSEPPDDSDQEDLDKFIAEIEDAADREWAEEEAAEERELGTIRYWNREEIGGRTSESDDEDADNLGGDNEWDSGNAEIMSDLGSDYDSAEANNEFKRSRVEKGKLDKICRSNATAGFKRNAEPSYERKMAEVDSESENDLRDLDNAMWKSDAEEDHDSRSSEAVSTYDFRSSID
ncbi:hypothetical protein SLEP1_g45243 [Rubroshorea leprosula]|uniref:Uncharacterized protein n=1 Tax=Rubroshorea leprosula TaxID=152421 RepID=A0AAV5LIL5_9ROSI|nr:hypothetical protein SLEP1_g45243 [Rubroshorea leprosula]